MWTADKSELEKAVILDAYLGSFSSKQIPVEITLTDENGNLTAIAKDQPTLTFESIGTDTFSYSPAGIEIHFKETKNEFTLKVNGQEFLFNKI